VLVLLLGLQFSKSRDAVLAGFAWESLKQATWRQVNVALGGSVAVAAARVFRRTLAQ